MRAVRRPCLPARPNSARASRPRCCRLPPMNSHCRPSNITLVTADTARTANEGYTVRQPVHAEQCDCHPPRGGAGARIARCRSRAAAGLASGRSARRRRARCRRPMGGNLATESWYPTRCCTCRPRPPAGSGPRRSSATSAAPSRGSTSRPRLRAARPTSRIASFPGMLHARIVRPPQPGARLEDVDAGDGRAHAGRREDCARRGLPGCGRSSEWQAIKAMRALAAARALDRAPVPTQSKRSHACAREHRSLRPALSPTWEARPQRGRMLEATYTRPYQIHGSIGPSCAIALADAEMLTIWSHTQGVFPDRAAIAEMLGLPIEQVRCIHVEGSGCYGHNGADDAAADAAVIARAMPGMPIRVQWTTGAGASRSSLTAPPCRARFAPRYRR